MQDCFMAFCNAEHCTCDIGGQRYMNHNPSLYGISKTSTHPSKGTMCGYRLKLKGNLSNCTHDCQTMC